MAIFHGTTIPSAAGGYDISNSLRFNKADSPSLTRTPSSAGNRQKYTLSFWMKRGAFTSGSHFYLFSTDANNSGQIYITNSNEQLGTQNHQHGTDYRTTNKKFRDISNWYHVMVAVDTTLATANHRVRMYINGVEETSFTGSDNPAQNSNSDINSTTEHMIGNIHGQTRHFDGYIAEYHLVDGQQLTPSDFGEVGDYGEWKTKEYSGTYGTNGCYLNFSKTSQVHNITKINSVQHSTSIKKIDASSINLTGTNAFSIPDHANWSPTGDFTYEMWVYMNGSQTGWSNICSQADGTNRGLEFGPDGSGNWMARHSTKGNLTVTIPSLNTWHHMAFCRQGNTARLYLNGVEVDTDAGYTGSLNNCADVLLFGNSDTGFDQNFNGYLDEIRFSNVCRYEDGTTFTPSTSAFTDDDDTFLLIHSNAANGNTTFTDSSGANRSLGSDSSGNNNHWTLNNITASDHTSDCPANNYCTFNNLEDNAHHAGHYGEGNLEGAGKTGSYFNMGSVGTMYTTKKLYFEVYLTAQTNPDVFFGVPPDDYHPSASPSNDAVTNWPGKNFPGASVNCSYNVVRWDSSQSYSFTTVAATGDIWGVAFDPATGKFWVHQNGTWFSSGNPSTGANPLCTLSDLTTGSQPRLWTCAAGQYQLNSRMILNCGQDGTFNGNKAAQGNMDDNDQGNFYYTVPTGFLALCENNLDDPAVIPSENFNTVLYTGSGSSQTITTGFDTDLVWVKNRGRASEHILVDTLRGDGKVLHSHLPSAEVTPNGAPSLVSTGFTVSSSDDWYNRSSDTYASWSWKAGGAGTANTDGSINSVVSANTDAGFSIVTHSGAAGNGTVGHGLTKAPNLVITKSRADSDQWRVGSIQPLGSMDFTDYLKLNATTALTDESTTWNDTAPTSTVFSVGTDSATNHPGYTYVSYCFHGVDGYSRIGSYEGNGNANGTFVYCGFRPAFLLLKNMDASGWNWRIMDSARSTYNVVTKFLEANVTATETSNGTGNVDFLSNGFKFRVNDAGSNGTNTYMYYAIAEQPFKYTNAR